MRQESVPGCLSQHMANANNGRQLHGIWVNDWTRICTLMIKNTANSIYAECRGINCHGVMIEEEIKHRLTLSASSFSFSHTYTYTLTLTCICKYTNTHMNWHTAAQSACRPLYGETAVPWHTAQLVVSMVM